MAQEVPPTDWLQALRACLRAPFHGALKRALSAALLCKFRPALIERRFELLFEIWFQEAVQVARVRDDLLRPIRPDLQAR